MLAIGLVALHREVLLFAAVGLMIGGLDDFLVDTLFLCRRCWRDLIVYGRHSRMTTATLPASPQPGTVAIFIPAWREANVIGPMLHNALSLWKEDDYRIFVGVYPNDQETLSAVTDVTKGESRIIIGINPRPGPTTKADCLNVLWRRMLEVEAQSGTPFKSVLLHDAEHVVSVVNRLATQFRVGQRIWSNTIRI